MFVLSLTLILLLSLCTPLSLFLPLPFSHAHTFFLNHLKIKSQFQYFLETVLHNNSIINIDVVLLSHLRLYSYFTNCSTNIFIAKKKSVSVYAYSGLESNPAAYNAFSCHVSFISISLFFITWTLFKEFKWFIL